MGRVHGDTLPQKGDHEFHHRMESGTIMEYRNHMESYGMIWNDMGSWTIYIYILITTYECTHIIVELQLHLMG